MIKVYNTLSQKKEPFKPKDPMDVKMYVCGPTVYDFLHIGNFRGPIFFNVVRNWIEKSGMKVRYAYNYTDIDDKIINRAKDEKTTSNVISERYIQEFEKDFRRLGLRSHDYNPRVTEHLDSIIDVIQKLIDQEKAYVVDGEVFYRIKSFKNYGALSKKKLDELQEGHRVEVDSKKEDPFDFVLWKPSKEGEPEFESPWSKGRPGWHIECTAMIQAIFGETIDIHGGGIDLIFPHHENEIAQGEGCCDHKYCQYWMHNNFINMNDEKMSKSLGNVVTARQFMDTHHPEVLKFMFLEVHYRSMLTVNQERIYKSYDSLYKLYSTLELLDFYSGESEATSDLDLSQVSTHLQSQLETIGKQISKGLDDDFNTSELISGLFQASKVINKFVTKKKDDQDSIKFARKWVREYASVASLLEGEPKKVIEEFESKFFSREKGLKRDELMTLLSERSQARENKDWKKSDEIRDKLLSHDIEVLDGHPTRNYFVHFSI